MLSRLGIRRIRRFTSTYTNKDVLEYRNIPATLKQDRAVRRGITFMVVICLIGAYIEWDHLAHHYIGGDEYFAIKEGKMFRAMKKSFPWRDCSKCALMETECIKRCHEKAAAKLSK